MATRKTATTTTTASDAYAAHAADIGRLLDLIRDELAPHAARANAAPRDWGFAGDLGKVRSDLVDTYEFISRKDFNA